MVWFAAFSVLFRFCLLGVLVCLGFVFVMFVQVFISLGFGLLACFY